MPPIVISNLGLGLNLHDPKTEIADGQLAGAENIVPIRGVLTTPEGCARLGSASLPLAAGILGLCHYREQGSSPTDHIVAMTRTGLFRRNVTLDTWTSISPTTALVGRADDVPSFVAFPHDDAIKADGDSVDSYFHLIACDDGNSPIQRWAGKFETKFYPLAGADGYHEADTDPPTPTAHYAKQVSAFYNHLMLVNPRTWDAESNAHVENPQTILFGKAGLLEDDPNNPSGKGEFDITEGAGTLVLVDTGDSNVRVELMDDLLIVYQTHSLWFVYHVGDTDVFRSKLQNPNLGLLAPGLLAAWRNQHFFVGHDYKPYVCYGSAANLRQLGGQIDEALYADMDQTKLPRCRLGVSKKGDYIWIAIVRKGYEYPTRVYLIDTLTGAWAIRDFEHLYDTTSGLTCLALAGSQQYSVGRTYQQAIDSEETYNDAITAGTTYEQILSTALVDEQLLFGDSAGNVFAFDPALTTDNGTNIPCHADTKVFDWGRPDLLKTWSTLNVRAKGSALQISYRIDNFETQDTGWTALTATDLTSEYATYEYGLDDIASEAIQFRIANTNGSTLTVQKLVLDEPDFEDNG